MSADTPSEIWPICRITVDAEGKVIDTLLYAPGLPEGTHDLYPVAEAGPRAITPELGRSIEALERGLLVLKATHDSAMRHALQAVLEATNRSTQSTRNALLEHISSIARVALGKD
jgi:hypothetical protein